MFKSLDIQEHMEVVGSDGKHVGTVDHKEGGDRLMLTKDDPKAGGHHHLISIDWVDYVDRKVHLNKPSQKATVEWQTVARFFLTGMAARLRPGFAIFASSTARTPHCRGERPCRSKSTTRATS